MEVTFFINMGLSWVNRRSSPYVRRSQGLFWIYRSGKLTTLIEKQIANGRELGLIQQMLTAGGQKFSTPGAIPQGGYHLAFTEQYPAESQNK